MKKKLFILILLAWLFSDVLAAQADQNAFEKAKLLIFDKQWAAALQQLNEVIEHHAESRYYAAALFYRGKCQEELGEKKQALESYENFVKTSAGSNLAEEAQFQSLIWLPVYTRPEKKIICRKYWGGWTRKIKWFLIMPLSS